MTTAPRKTFFCHLTDGLCLPEPANLPFSMIRTAGNSWRGMDKRMAMESTGQLVKLTSAVIRYC